MFCQYKTIYQSIESFLRVKKNSSAPKNLFKENKRILLNLKLFASPHVFFSVNNL